jgi:hypothetical protein
MTSEQLVSALALREAAGAEFQASMVGCMLLEGMHAAGTDMEDTMLVIIKHRKMILNAPRFVPPYNA